MEIKKLKDLCIGKGEYGIAAPAEPFSENKYRYLRITDISDNGTLLSDDPKSVSCQGCEKCILQENDIVFARTGNSTGRAFFYEPKYGELVYAGFLIKFHLDDTKVNPKYMKYYTISQTYRNWVNNGPTGSTRGNMSEGDFADMPVFLPSRKQQDAIVNLFSPLDDKIDNNNAIAAELEGMAKDLYDYWFVQFDFPDENGKPYKSSGGKMVWNEELKREIPEGWEVASFSKCIQSINTGLNPRDNFKLNTGGTVRYITVKNLTTNGSIDFSSCDFIDNKARDIVHQRSDISKGDILFASIAPLGRCFLIDESPENWDINESVFSIRPNYANVTSLFLYMTFMGETFIKTATNSSTGSVFKGLRINDLLNMKTIIPALPVLKSFDKQMNPMFAMKSKCSNEILELASLRDFLLPMLMNGQVSVREKPSISNVSG